MAKRENANLIDANFHAREYVVDRVDLNLKKIDRYMELIIKIYEI